MIADQLERLLTEVLQGLDVSHRPYDDMAKRFKALRGYGLLPRGPGKNARDLTTKEIAAGMLSIATGAPGFGGQVAKILMNLRPVGGPRMSFHQAETFGDAIDLLVSRPSSLETLLEVRITPSEIYTNSHCRATLVHVCDGAPMSSHYVSSMAMSLLQYGAEKNFDARRVDSDIVAETILYPGAFREIHRALDHDRYDVGGRRFIKKDESSEEIRARRRARLLGLEPNSRFLNMAVDGQVTWPREEQVVFFEGVGLVLMPKTNDHATSIHVDLTKYRLSSENALTLIRRFLSLLTWCDDQYAILQDGWSGNPIPVPVRKRNLAFHAAQQWPFDRKLPNSLEALKAIAIYREARNAEQNFLIAYAVLGYYKIIELRHGGRSEARKWYRDNFCKLEQYKYLADDIATFLKACGTEQPHDYLYRACRTAVAHANKPFSTDPDDTLEIRRLHSASGILRALAREFIRGELQLSDSPFDGT